MHHRLSRISGQHEADRHPVGNVSARAILERALAAREDHLLLNASGGLYQQLLHIDPASLRHAGDLSRFATLLSKTLGHIARTAPRNFGGAPQRQQLHASTRAKLTSIAQYCNERERHSGFFSQLSPSALAGLCNAFSKCPADEHIRVACAGMARIFGSVYGLKPHHISMLANAFAKWPRERDCQAACAEIAAHIANLAVDLWQYRSQGIANLANAFSKWPDNARCRAACMRLAQVIADPDTDPKQFNPQELANLANAFAKWPREGACQYACARIAAQVGNRGVDLGEFNAQGLANLANAFSKWPDDAHCRAACGGIARRLAHPNADLGQFEPHNLAHLANAFSKWPDNADCRAACARLAQRVTSPHLDAGAFDPQTAVNLANAFAKWPDNTHCRNACLRLAQQAANPQTEIGQFTPQGLHNLANAFAKWPDNAHCQAACARLARHVADSRTDLRQFGTQGMVNLANAFAKWPDHPDCHAACARLAQQQTGPDGDAEILSPQELANLANAFSKRPDDAHCREAGLRLARRVAEPRTDLGEFDPPALAMLANAFSKWPDQEDCRAAVARLARRVADPVLDLAQFASLNLAHLANAFSKWADDADCRTACIRLARKMAASDADLVKLDPQAMANLANAFIKFPDSADCHAACTRLARHVASLDVNLAQFSPQALHNLANAFSKWPDDAHCRDACTRLAQHVTNPDTDLGQFYPQGWVNFANAFVKFPDNADCRAACLRIAGCVVNPDVDPGKFTSQGLVNLANAFAKWPEDARCREACVRLARHVANPAVDPGQFEPQGLANLANAVAKWADDADCRNACARLALRVVDPAVDLTAFDAQNVATLANAFSKWPNDADCHAACTRLALRVGDPAVDLVKFTPQHLSILANAFSRCVSMDAEEEDSALIQSLGRIAQHLVAHPGAIGESVALNISMMLKALRHEELTEEMHQLAPSLMNRLFALMVADGLVASALETVGNVSIGLRPLLRRKRHAQHKQACAQLLHHLQPIIERKLALYLRQGQQDSLPAANAEAHATRCPALTCYQILATYRDLVQAKVKVRAPAAVDLDAWSRSLHARTATLMESDLSDYSWNTIARLEAEQPGDILDRFVETHLERITAGRPPASFDMRAVFDSMDHEPRMPDDEAGLFRVPLHDFRGRRREDDLPAQYSILARLTQNRLPAILVELPGQMSALLLGRIIHVQGVPYRLDLFGGSKMKIEGETLDRIFSNREESRTKPRDYGKLFAVPLADSTPHSDLAQLLTQLFPYQESFYYFQRMMMPSPPGMAERPQDHILEGNFSIGMLPDRAAGAHPFRIRNAQGQPIALQPHDGCGFIKQSLAQKMAWHASAQQAAPYGQPQSANLPAQALQHYGPNDAVTRETIERMAQTLGAKAPQKEHLYRALTAGSIRGDIAVAVPSADDKVHLPSRKSTLFDAQPQAHLLIGKSPYDKPNLRPIERLRVATQEDATARFLSGCTAFQYSFVAQQEESQGKASLMGAKGVLIALPDALWPDDFSGQDLVMSAEDMKLHSDWTESKQRDTRDSTRQVRGILAVTNIFPPGSAIAMPLAEQKKLDGDFDGDPLLILANRPALYAHVRDSERQRKEMPSLKPPKSHTPALDENGRYRFGRANQIMATRGQVLQDFVGLQTAFLALPVDIRERVAQGAVAALYADDAPTLRKESPAYVENDALQTMLNLLSLGIKIGTDAYKSDTGTETYREVGLRLKRLFRSENVALSAPYGKGLARKLAAGRFDLDASLAALEHNPTLAAQVMRAAGMYLREHDLLPKSGEAAQASEEPPLEEKPPASARRPSAWSGSSAQHLRSRTQANPRSGNPPAQARTTGKAMSPSWDPRLRRASARPPSKQRS